MATATQINNIVALYSGYFNRAPDPAGQQFWISQIDAGRPLETIAGDFANDVEARALYPFLTTPDVSSANLFVVSVYNNLFNRAPDAAGLTFWTGVIQAGTVPVGDMIAAIMVGAVDTTTTTPPTLDMTTLTNKQAAGLDFVTKAGTKPGFIFDASAKAAATTIMDGVTSDPATVTAAAAASTTFLTGTANPGTTQVLTTTVGEALVGTAGDDTFSGTTDVLGLGATPAATINSGDTIDGLGGTDTVSLVSTSVGAALPAGLVKNVEIVNLVADTAADGFSAGDANVSNFFGVQQLWQIGGAGSQVATNVTDAVTIGFNATNVNDLQMATGATTANVALANVTTGGTINIGETTAGTLTTANVSGSVAGAGATALTIDMDTAAASGGVAASAEATLNLGLTSNTNVTINSASLKTIDASTSSGNLTIVGTATTETLKGGTGIDTLTGGAASKLIEGGAGSDIITSGGVAGEVINGGANGTGTVKLDAITLGANSQTVLTNVGESGLTLATADQVTTFATTSDKLDFNLTAGSATNTQQGGLSSSFTDGLTNANTAMNGTVQYFVTNDAANNYVFVDSDLDGTADMGISLVGAGSAVVFGDIIA